MRHVVDLVHPQSLGRFTEYLREHFPDPVQNDLTIGKSHIDRAFHRLEIILSFRRIEWRAGELAVFHIEAIFVFHDFQEDLQIVGGHLVPEPAAAAMKHHDDLVRLRDPELRGQFFVKNVLGLGDLDLQIMISRSQRAELVEPAFDGVLADPGDVRPGHTSPSSVRSRSSLQP